MQFFSIDIIKIMRYYQAWKVVIRCFHYSLLYGVSLNTLYNFIDYSTHYLG